MDLSLEAGGLRSLVVTGQQRVLIVGAGAVGQVYGWYLSRGGAEVSFYVKEKYLEDARAGFALYPLNTRRTRFDADFDITVDLGLVERMNNRRYHWAN